VSYRIRIPYRDPSDSIAEAGFAAREAIVDPAERAITREVIAGLALVPGISTVQAWLSGVVDRSLDHSHHPREPADQIVLTCRLAGRGPGRYLNAVPNRRSPPGGNPFGGFSCRTAEVARGARQTGF
jgi:hypothetical protein